MSLTSLAHLTVIDADPMTLIKAARSGGFDAIGLRINAPFPTDHVFPTVGNSSVLRDIRHRLDGTGVGILDIEAFWLHPETRVDALLPALDAGAGLGAKNVLTVGNDREPGRLAERFSDLCAAANERGLRVMLEFIPYSGVATLAEAAALLARVAPANAGLLVDALHLSRSGGRPADISACDPALLSYMHLCDAPMRSPSAEGLRQESRGDRLAPGDGELWLDEFVAAFPAGTPMAVEAPVAALDGLPPVERAVRIGARLREFLGRNGNHGADETT